VFSFIMEPLVEWLNLVVYMNWKYAYSFPIYIVMPIVARWLVERFRAKQI